ncbi:MAG TPA: ThiF family adenylyltransferase [Gammaproteobacteria bacterium]|nr:ThiF family adenylyltransferase [Gammaproteobacteria bacterium]
MAREFDYAAAFSRNLGLVNPQEQEVLRNSRVAIAGLGGVGGVHLTTLARMGIGHFRIADFDTFEIQNFNRQTGAVMSTLDEKKVEVMSMMARDINPEADIQCFHEGIARENVSRFLEGSDVALDGLDFTAVEARDVFYDTAYRMGIPVVAVGPVGCSAASLVFLPGKMTWQEYFAMDLAKSDFDRYILFITGTAPAALHMPYIDRRYVDLEAKHGPSLALAVQFCAGMAATETLKLLLKRGTVHAAPYYQQFDAYRGRYATGKLRWGNRGPIQRIKFMFAKKLLRKMQAA